MADAIDRAATQSVRRLTAVQRAGLRAFLDSIDALRREMLVAVVQSSPLSPGDVNTLRSRMTTMIQGYERQWREIMSDNQRRSFVRGIQSIDAILKAQGEGKPVEYLSENLLTQAQGYGAELITKLADDVRARVAEEIQLSVMGGKPMTDTVAAIGRNLKDASVFGTIANRARVIFQTETARVYNMSAAARLIQMSRVVPGVKKRWMHSHRTAPRLGHLDLDGVAVGATERFDLVGKDGKRYTPIAPHDPILPASEVVNCMCILAPVVPRVKTTTGVVPGGPGAVQPPKRAIALPMAKIRDTRWSSVEKVSTKDLEAYRSYWNGLSAEDQTRINEIRTLMEKSLSTKDKATRTGGYSEDRKAWHQRMVDDSLAQGKVAKGRRKPKLLITGGKPGAGKSTAIRGREDILAGEYIHIDSDEYKGKHPEYRGWNAGLVHDEIDDEIIDRVIKGGMNQRKSILYDATLKSSERVQKLIEEAKAKGYEVEIVFVDADTEVSLRNAHKRWKGGHKEWGATAGRFVDPSYIATHNGKNKANFEKIKGFADAYSVWRFPADATTSTMTEAKGYKPGTKPGDLPKKKVRVQKPKVETVPIPGRETWAGVQDSLMNTGGSFDRLKETGEIDALLKGMAEIDDVIEIPKSLVPKKLGFEYAITGARSSGAFRPNDESIFVNAKKWRTEGVVTGPETVAHEYGHVIDWSIGRNMMWTEDGKPVGPAQAVYYFPTDEIAGTPLRGGFFDQEIGMDAVRAWGPQGLGKWKMDPKLKAAYEKWRRAVEESDLYKETKTNVRLPGEAIEYLNSGRETFARSFSQFVARRNPGGVIAKSIELFKRETDLRPQVQWKEDSFVKPGYDDFAKIDEAMAELLETAGVLKAKHRRRR